MSPGATGARLQQTPDVLVWTARLPSRIPADYPVDARKAHAWPQGRLEMRLAGNETGILPLFLTATGGDLATVSVEIETPPPGKEQEYDLRLATVEPLQYLGDLYYDVLVPNDAFPLLAGVSRMVWLSVTMPPGSSRRALRGVLRVRAAGRDTVRIPFTVEPFRFDLPREPALPFSVGIPRPGRRVRPEERRQWWRDIARHRLSIRHLAEPNLHFEGDKAGCDFARFDAELACATRLGMRLFQLPFAYVAWGHGSRYTQRFGPLDEQHISVEFRRKFTNVLRVLARHLEKKGVLDRFNHNLFDEPYPKHYAQVAELARLMKQADPRYRPSIYGGGTAAANGPLAGIIEESVGAGEDPNARRILRRRGALVSVCNPLQTFDITRRPELVRGFPWWVFRCRIDRVYQWCICPSPPTMHAADYGSAWVFLDPPHDAFLSTVRFEMLREGMEDYDYLALFRKAVEKVAEELGIADIDTYRIADFFAAQLSGTQIMKQSTDPDRYGRVRNFLGHAIEELPQPPLVLFRLSRPAGARRIRLSVWTEPGVRTSVRADAAAVPVSASVELTVGAAKEIELFVSKAGRTKRLRIPVLKPLVD